MEYTRKEKILIKTIVKSIDSNLKVSFKKNMWFRKNNLISIGTKEEKSYTKWYQQEFPQCANINWWFAHLLHEIGHYKTSTPIGQAEMYVEYILLQKEMELKPDTTPEEDWEFDVRYFTIKGEYEATKWGIDFYLRNVDYVEKMSKILNF